MKALGLVLLLATAGQPANTSSVSGWLDASVANAEVRDAAVPDVRPVIVDAGVALADAAPPRPIRKVRVAQRRRRAAVDAGVRDAPAAADAAAGPVDAGLTRPDAALAMSPPPSPVVAPPEEVANPLLWLLLIAAALLAARTADVFLAQRSLQGGLGHVLRAGAVFMRLLSLGLTLALLAKVAPGMGQAWPWVLAGAAGLAVLAGRDVFRDVFAFFVLRFERRVRLGRRLDAPAASGEVLRIGLRAVRLRDDTGATVDVPNHLLLASPMRTDAEGWPRQVVQVRLPVSEGASTRRILEDAVRASPWVPIDAEVRIQHDPSDPERWTVQAQFQDGRAAERFAGEIADQAQARLRAEAELS